MRSVFGIFLALGAVASCVPSLSSATNGMNMIGYNTRSAGLGGADVALDGDCPGCNPATLGGDGKSYVSGGIGLVHPPVGFENTLFGPNDVKSDDRIYPVPYFEYARRLGDNDTWTLGIGVRAQGGMGVDFDDVRTFAGNLDSLSTDLQVARIMPTLAYQPSDNLSLGASLMIGYSRMTSELYPNTYSPGPDGVPGTPDDFAGMKIKDVDGVGYAARLGLHYRVNDRLSLGFTYTSETDIDLDGGDLTLNLGVAKVGYDAQIDDFAWPREAELGLAFDATPQLKLVTDVRWIDWASALEKITVRGSNPNLPVPLANPVLPFEMNWDEQWVFAVGAEYAYTPEHTFRIGYNYGASPVPDDYLVPLFPGHVEQHLTLGYGYTTGNLRFDLAWEHSFTRSQTNTNPNPVENPFGPDSKVTVHSGNVLHLGLNYQY